MKLHQIQLDILYQRAKSSFFECAAGNPEQILEETGVPFASIKPYNDSVRVTFAGDLQDSYIIETKLKLVSEDGKVLGWYCLHEDENQNVVDDFLVFD